MTKQEVQTFRGDFQKAVAQLEEQYGVNISLAKSSSSIRRAVWCKH